MSDNCNGDNNDNSDGNKDNISNYKNNSITTIDWRITIIIILLKIKY